MRLVVPLLLLSLVVTASVAASTQTESVPLPYVPGSWTLVILPDVQNYCSSHPLVFVSQTRWIAENKDARSIRFVLQEGDVTNHNTPSEWENARAAMKLLDGVVPYAIVTGNHDYAGDNHTERRTLLNDYFPVGKFEDMPTFGGVYERGKMENSYHLFSAGDRRWLILALEWGPRDSVLKWADKVLSVYPDRSAIILTHAYLFCDNNRFDAANPSDKGSNPHKYWTAHLPGGTNDGEEIWRKLASQHENVVFVFCGHVQGDGAGRLTSIGVNGNPVHQILANYQFRPKGGEGYLRLVEFPPDGKTVQVRTYSTLLDRYMTDDEQQFVLDLPPAIGGGGRQ